MNIQVLKAAMTASRSKRPHSRSFFPCTNTKLAAGYAPMARWVAGLLPLLLLAFSALAHEHPKANSDSRFLDRLERPDNAANPSRDRQSRLCCTDKDAVKVDYELVPSNGKYAEADWYVWVDLDGKGLSRVRVPPDKIVRAHAPSGQAYVFVLGQSIQCFVRPLPRS